MAQLGSSKDLTLYQAFDGYLDGYGPGLYMVGINPLIKT